MPKTETSPNDRNDELKKSHQQVCENGGTELIVNSISDNKSNTGEVKDNDDGTIANETEIDIYSFPEDTIPEWQPNATFKPLEKQKMLFLDIETTGLDPKTSRVILIGLMCEWKRSSTDSFKIITDVDEKKMLEEFNDYLAEEDFDLLIGHNIYGFDLPYIVERMAHHLVYPKRPITRAKKLRLYNRIEYTALFMAGVDVLDTYIAVSNHDFTARKLSSYGLKTAVIELGLRKKRRLELSAVEIIDLWNSGNVEKIVQYLRLDLIDTFLLSNKLHPIINCQRMMLPDYSIQEIACAGEGVKWNMMLCKYYGYRPHIVADAKIDFEGGTVIAQNIGLHPNVSKIDVSSLYTSIMVLYQICSKKDEDRFSLAVLKYMMEERLKLKAKAKQGDKEAEHKQQAMKNMINSLYGFLGSGFFQYNDMEAAAMVARYGRKILQVMIDKMNALGCTIIECDTDGIIFHHSDSQLVCEEVQKVLPTGINIELEFDNAYAVYMAKKKHYIVFRTKDDYFVKGGNFRGRNRCLLQKEFPVIYVQKYLESPDAASKYHQDILEEIASGNFAIDKLMIRRKIAKNEKQLAHLGKPGDTVFYYITENGSKDNHGEYSIIEYLELVDKLKKEIDDVIAKTKRT
ncbi:MAG: ribonuclease H-like domain-containing protein [Nitrospirae bacterium]|nr:ribonuclease H-like domain-containing protein [Nitrospirota bacterium]MBF0553735.1 ribonuclease H-like domain-containing protein [Nitrospirota bacterium]